MGIHLNPGLEKVHRLHAVDLYQRSGGYRGQYIEVIFSWFEKALSIFANHQVQYLPYMINQLLEEIKKISENPDLPGHFENQKSSRFIK